MGTMAFILLVCLFLPLFPFLLLLLLLLLLLFFFVEVDFKIGEVLKEKWVIWILLCTFTKYSYLGYLGTERVEWESLGAWIKTHGLIGS